MEQELKLAVGQKEEEIDALNSTIQELKMNILKLQHRNQLDRESEAGLMEKVKQQEEIIEELRRKGNQAHSFGTKEIVKEVVVERELVNPSLED